MNIEAFGSNARDDGFVEFFGEEDYAEYAGHIAAIYAKGTYTVDVDFDASVTIDPSKVEFWLIDDDHPDFDRSTSDGPVLDVNEDGHLNYILLGEDTSGPPWSISFRPTDLEQDGSIDPPFEWDNWIGMIWVRAYFDLHDPPDAFKDALAISASRRCSSSGVSSAL